MALGDYASLASLGVPTLPSDDGPSGIRADGTTSLPSAQTLAATFDRGLARAYGEAIGAEARGKGFNWWLGPAMDIARTPLAGRQPENLGEDPFLAGETVAQEVAGAKSRHVIATLKHYVANNAGVGPHRLRHPDRAHAGRRQRHRLRARAAGDLRGAVQARDPRGRRRRGHVLLQPPQRAADVREPGAALRPQGLGLRRLRGAGLHLRRQGPARRDARRPRRPRARRRRAERTAAMFTSGQVPAARLDDIVRRTLFAMFDSGAFDDPLGPAAADVSTPEHQAPGDAGVRGRHGAAAATTRHALPLGGRARCARSR